MAALLIAVTAMLALGAAGCDSGGEPAPAPRPPSAAEVGVTVRLDEPAPARGSMNGFIHSLSSEQPPDALVAPLAPRLWRSDLLRAPVDRARALGARYVFVLSDAWGYPPTGWAGRGPPWADLGGWERFVRRVARANRDAPIAWDIWNEPNSPEFWDGGRERFFETYAVANRVLREELGPDAVIGGPSTSRYAPELFGAFLDHCLAASCSVDFLSWHENLTPLDPLDSIGAHLTDARTRFLGDPRWAALGIREIHVNEYVGREDRYLPGEAVAYLAQLERGGADLAARSCWTEVDCAPAALDGLLATDGSPRGIWWVHRWYADGAASRVASESGDASVSVLASAPAPGTARVLVGRAAQRPAPEAAPPPEAAVALELTGLTADAPLALRLERVPAVGENAVATPEVVVERELNATARGTLRVSLPALAEHEAMLVTTVPTGADG